MHIKTIKEIPLNDRPREKMANNGAAALTDAELIAILLRTGTTEKSAIDIASEMTADGGLYKRLAGITHLHELTNIKGLGQTYHVIVAAVNLFD